MNYSCKHLYPILLVKDKYVSNGKCGNSFTFLFMVLIEDLFSVTLKSFTSSKVLLMKSSCKHFFLSKLRINIYRKENVVIVKLLYVLSIIYI